MHLHVNQLSEFSQQSYEDGAIMIPILQIK